MKSTVRILIILAGVFIIVGAIVAFTAIAIGGFRFSSLNTGLPYSEKNYTYDAAGVTELEIRDISCDVNLIGSGDQSVKIVCYENEKDYYTISLSTDGKLSIVKSISKNWYDFFGINFNPHEQTLTIAVPAEFKAAVQVGTISGKITLSKIMMEGSLKADSTSGDISLKNITAGETSAQTVSGSLELDTTVVNGDLRLQTTSGEINVAATDIAGGLSAETTSGSMDFTDTRARDDIDAGSVSGDIKLDHLGGTDFSLKTISGAIRGSIVGNPGDYTFKADSVSGNIHLPDSASGKKSFKAATTSGGIDLEYSGSGS
ncbi:MAG: DUF4097 family beta strand repeat-containing protein [Clostridiaceae bacterium]|nr:DUF4097 family beta strand repeat-containing protein [Clostridiaceae bacterium]